MEAKKNVVCRQCVYYRHKAEINVLPSSMHRTAGIWGLESEWEDVVSEQQDQEQDLLDSEEVFLEEPNHLPWCAKWTELLFESSDKPIFDPVTGSKYKEYQLCARMNHDGLCNKFERK